MNASKVSGPHLNSEKVKLNILTGVCQHETRYGGKCGTSLTLKTWTGPDGIVKCPNCGSLCRVS